MSKELNDILKKLKQVQKQFQAFVVEGRFFDDAKKYAEKRSREAKQLIKADVSKVKSFLEKEQRELRRLQKQVPKEVKKIKKYLDAQRSEVEKLIGKLSNAKVGKSKKKSRGAAKKKTAKKTTAKKKTAKKTATKKTTAKKTAKKTAKSNS